MSVLNLAQETANFYQEFWWYSSVSPREIQSCVLQHAITMFLPVWDLGAISVVPEDLRLLGHDSVTGWVVIHIAEEHSVFIVMRDCIHGSRPLNVKAIQSFKMLGTTDPATLSYPKISKSSCLFILSLHHITLHNQCSTIVLCSSTSNKTFILLAWNIILPVVLYGCELGLLH